jgi:predicted nucleic acid-binding protein
VSLVLDTNVLVAAARTADPDHEPCSRLLRDARERLVVPSPALVEVDHLLRSGRLWMAILADITGHALIVEDLELADYERVHGLMARYADLRVGFVDCAVLAVVERLGEPKLATLDRRHFAAMRPAHVDSLELLPG